MARFFNKTQKNPLAQHTWVWNEISLNSIRGKCVPWFFPSVAKTFEGHQNASGAIAQRECACSPRNKSKGAGDRRGKGKKGRRGGGGRRGEGAAASWTPARATAIKSRKLPRPASRAFLATASGARGSSSLPGRHRETLMLRFESLFARPSFPHRLWKHFER